MTTEVSGGPARPGALPLAGRANPAKAISDRPLRGKASQRIAFGSAGTFFSPAGPFAWLLGLLGVAACIAPWLAHGWLWLGLAAGAFSVLACYDGLALWHSRGNFVPVLLPPDKGLRGSEGESISLPLALARSGSRRSRSELRLAIMPPTRESESAFRVEGAPRWLRLEQPNPVQGPASEHASAQSTLWPCEPEVALLRRGLWPVPRVGIERRSGFGFWRLRQWFDSSQPLRIEANLRQGRQEILRSPVYRALVAARQTPWSGQGRDFERLREYQPGDNYSEIAWKSTARRGAPVTRLFQWEQKQEVYFAVDQSRASALALDPTTAIEGADRRPHAPRRLLDLAIETALVGATVALELGDEFGLVTYADDPKSWLRAGSGQFHFQQFRDRLLALEPLPTTADYEALFGEIRLRLRRRAYLVLLADLAERSASDSLCRGIALARSSHVILMTSILPAHAQPAFAGAEPATDQDVYARLAGERENQRLVALARRLRQLDVRLRFVPPESFLRTAVEGYLEGKREQRL